LPWGQREFVWTEERCFAPGDLTAPGAKEFFHVSPSLAPESGCLLIFLNTGPLRAVSRARGFSPGPKPEPSYVLFARRQRGSSFSHPPRIPDNSTLFSPPVPFLFFSFMTEESHSQRGTPPFGGRSEPFPVGCYLQPSGFTGVSLSRPL